MNQNEFIVLGLVAVPVLALMLLRINAALVFFSLCLGYVLMQFLGGDASFLSALFTSGEQVSTNVLKLILLLAPAVLTAVFMIKTMRGPKFVINILPALGVGALVTLFVVPLLPPDTTDAITALPAWQEVVRLQDLIIGASALAALIVMWLGRPRHHKDKDHKKH